MAKKNSSKKAPAKAVVKNDFKVQPLGDRVLVRELKKDGEKTVSGIIIPESASDDRGAKKDDGVRVPMDVKVGDKVLYQWGDKLTIDGVEYEMVAESGILAIIK